MFPCPEGASSVVRVLRHARLSHTHALNPVARPFCTPRVALLRCTRPLKKPDETRTARAMLQDAMRWYTRGWGAGSAIKGIAAAIPHAHVHTRGEGSGCGPSHGVADGPLITRPTYLRRRVCGDATDAEHADASACAWLVLPASRRTHVLCGWPESLAERCTRRLAKSASRASRR